MNSFKPGDWVVNTTTDDYYDGIRNWFQLKETDLIFKQDVNATEWEANFKFINSHKIWQPKVGEWCWFWNQSDINLSISPHIGQYGNLSYSLEFYDNCEPFIGQLPTFIKDQS